MRCGAVAARIAYPHTRCYPIRSHSCFTLLILRSPCEASVQLDVYEQNGETYAGIPAPKALVPEQGHSLYISFVCVLLAGRARVGVVHLRSSLLHDVAVVVFRRIGSAPKSRRCGPVVLRDARACARPAELAINLHGRIRILVFCIL